MLELKKRFTGTRLDTGFIINAYSIPLKPPIMENQKKQLTDQDLFNRTRARAFQNIVGETIAATYNRLKTMNIDSISSDRENLIQYVENNYTYKIFYPSMETKYVLPKITIICAAIKDTIIPEETFVFIDETSTASDVFENIGKKIFIYTCSGHNNPQDDIVINCLKSFILAANVNKQRNDLKFSPIVIIE